MDSLSALALFVRVVDEGSFTAAAKALSISKSQVSKQIGALEDRLGARLLNRTTRKLSLTEVGAGFYERSRRILAEVEEAELAVSRLHSEPRGRLKVNAPLSFGLLHVAPALPEFLARHPALAVDLSLADRFVDVVDEGYDVVIRIRDLEDTSLIARRICESRRIVCASPTYWDAHGRPAHPSELAEHECLRYSYLPTPNDWPFRGPDGPFSVRVGGRLTTNNGDAVRWAALGGIGVAFSPAFLVGDAIAEGALEPVLEGFEAPPIGVHAVWPHNRHLSAKVRAFVDFLVERFGDRPPWESPRLR